jgi:hypothetical protein
MEVGICRCVYEGGMDIEEEEVAMEEEDEG